MSAEIGRFPWDGSHLGTHSQAEFICRKEIIDKEECWELANGEYCIAARSLPGKETLPCLVDEAKPLFGLVKSGTHRVTVGKTKYLLIFQQTVDGSLCWEPSLDSIPMEHPIRFDRRFREEVKRIFALRDLFGLGGHFERNITLRLEPNSDPLSPKRYHAMSRGETSTTLGSKNGRASLSEALRSRWFKEESLTQVTQRMCSFKGDPVETFARLRDQLTETAERIDKDSVVYINSLLERLSGRLASE